MEGNNDIQLVSPDGTFAENWTEQLGEGFEEHAPTLSRFKNVKDLSKSYAEARSKLGHDPEHLVQIPKDDSPDEVKAAFHKAHGKPEKEDGYEYKLPDDISAKIKIDDEKMAGFRKLSHGLNLNQKQHEGLLNFYFKDIADTQDKYKMLMAEQEKEDAEKGKAELRKKYGNGTEEKILRANAVMRKFGGDEAVAAFNAQNSPLMTEFLDNIASAMSEDTLKGLGAATDSSASAIKSQVAKIREEMTKIEKENPGTYRGNPKYKDLIGQKHELYKRMPA